MKYKFRLFYKDLMRFRVLKIIQLLLAIYIGILTFVDMGPPGGLRDPETGLIIDQESAERTEEGLILVNGVERAIVATTQFQVVCIGITRMSAFFMYPALVLVFTSKFRATMSFLTKSPLAMYMYNDSHQLHVYCGWTILLFSTIHVIFHIARWVQQNNLYLLFQHFSGLSGLVIISSCLLVSMPMTVLKRQIRFEIRKNLHYLFIVFAGSLVFHTPTSAIPNGGFTAWVFGIILVWYFLDATYCFFFMTEKIDTTKFSVLNSGVRMTMTVSDRFQKMGNQGGVCYVCLPWINKNQWHAFSLFEDPANPAERQIFIQKRGDWTKQVHRALQRDTVRPAWVSGPFPSPYDNADAYDNQILVATGIGITPALSVIRAHKDTRRINLVWVVHDETLLEFFLKHLYLDHNGWNLIFYTGRRKLRDQYANLESDTNICLISGRPNLKELIPNIIYGIESGFGLPEKYSQERKVAVSESLASELLLTSNKSQASCGGGSGGGGDDEKSIASMIDLMENLAVQASELGFRLSTDGMVEELGGFERSSQTEEIIFSEDDTAISVAINGNLSIGFRPWKYGDDGFKDFVKTLDKSLVLPTWGILYCGGAKKALSILEEISDEYEIGLHVESFDW